MTDTRFEQLVAEISRAQQFAKDRQVGLAAQSFALLRAMIVDQADRAVLRQMVAAERVPRRAARETFRAAVAGRGDVARPLLILTDAAALPGSDVGVQGTFAWLLGSPPHSYSVDCIGQQGFQSADVLALLSNAPKLGRGADVVIMIGQSDSAQPLLQEDERLAMSMLPDDLRNLLQDFTTQYGGTITGHLPARAVTPVGRFRANVNGILRLLRAREALRIVVVTILSSGDRVAHNTELLRAGHLAGAIVVDFDRMARHAVSGLTDQGQWSDTLHRLFGETLADALASERASEASIVESTGLAMQ
jgi:hypothetical protein